MAHFCNGVEIVTRKVVKVAHPDGSGAMWTFDISKSPAHAPLAGYYPVELTGEGSIPAVDALAFDGTKYTGERVPFPASRQDSLLEFSDRFSDAEFDAITDSVDADVARAWKKFKLAEYIDRDDARTVGFLDLLVAKGVIDAARKTAVLA